VTRARVVSILAVWCLVSSITVLYCTGSVPLAVTEAAVVAALGLAGYELGRWSS
jgi:hypothetical protein